MERNMPLIIEVKVVPNSGKQKIILDKSGQLKIYLKSLPERGLANLELVKLFAKECSFSQNEIEIVSGLSSRKKKIKILKDITFDKLLNILNIDMQLMLRT
jgi:uncharacterized protein